MSTVYLLHFSERYPAGRRPGHYVGVARELDVRIAEHRRGNPGKGGSLTRALKQKGITFVVANEWHFGTADEAFEFERKLKGQRHHARHCPVCQHRAVADFERGVALAFGVAGETGVRGGRRAARRRTAQMKRGTRVAAKLAEFGASVREAVAVGLSQKRRRP